MDLLIVNGTVLDPSQGFCGSFDIGVTEGKIADWFAPGTVQAGLATEVVDAAGCFVVPGLIDLHTHVFERRTTLGIKADRVGIRQGVTTLVDAGSTGSRDFPAFLREVVELNQTQVLLWINIASQGLCDGRSELADLSLLKPNEIERLIKQFPLIRGIKARMSRVCNRWSWPSALPREWVCRSWSILETRHQNWGRYWSCSTAGMW
jgi:dihydroorotase